MIKHKNPLPNLLNNHIFSPVTKVIKNDQTFSPATEVIKNNFRLFPKWKNKYPAITKII